MCAGTEAAEIDRLLREERPRLSDGPGDLLQRAQAENFAFAVIVEDECTESVGVKGMGDRLPLPVTDKSVATTRNHDHRAPLLSGMYRMRIARNRYGCVHTTLDGLRLCGDVQREPTGGKRGLLGFLIDQFCIIYTCVNHHCLHPSKNHGASTLRASP